MPYEKRGYQAAARHKHRDPQKREDARWIATYVHRDPAGGVRRDWLIEQFPGWSTRRFIDALMAAYAMSWVCFCGWSYVCAPAPGVAGPRCEPPPAPESLEVFGGHNGMLPISEGTT